MLAEVDVVKPRIPVISNVDAKPHSDPAVIKDILAKQVTSPVLWEDAVAGVLAAGFEKGYELGPGKVVSGVLKRISKTAVMENVAYRATQLNYDELVVYSEQAALPQYLVVYSLP